MAILGALFGVMYRGASEIYPIVMGIKFNLSETTLGKFFAGQSEAKKKKEVSVEEISKVTPDFIIGDQEWMTVNLNVDTFRNGDPISEIKDPDEWQKAAQEGKPAWCYFKNDIANGEKYGKLYNWYAVNDPRGLAPEGWRIPTEEEWIHLAELLGGEDGAADKMRSASGWSIEENEIEKHPFEGKPGGNRTDVGSDYNAGFMGFWWSSTEQDEKSAWCHYIAFDNDRTLDFNHNKGYGFSVRCIRE